MSGSAAVGIVDLDGVLEALRIPRVGRTLTQHLLTIGLVTDHCEGLGLHVPDANNFELVTKMEKQNREGPIDNRSRIDEKKKT